MSVRVAPWCLGMTSWGGGERLSWSGSLSWEGWGFSYGVASAQGVDVEESEDFVAFEEFHRRDLACGAEGEVLAC